MISSSRWYTQEHQSFDASDKFNGTKPTQLILILQNGWATFIAVQAGRLIKLVRGVPIIHDLNTWLIHYTSISTHSPKIVSQCITHHIQPSTAHHTPSLVGLITSLVHFISQTITFCGSTVTRRKTPQNSRYNSIRPITDDDGGHQVLTLWQQTKLNKTVGMCILANDMKSPFSLNMVNNRIHAPHAYVHIHLPKMNHSTAKCWSHCAWPKIFSHCGNLDSSL